MIRVKSQANMQYTAKTQRYVRKPLVPVTRYAHSIPDTANCCGCGWPLSAVPGSPTYEGTENGERKFKHMYCPTSRQRAELRRAALVSA